MSSHTKEQLNELIKAMGDLRVKPFRDRRGRESYKFFPGKGFVDWHSDYRCKFIDDKENEK